MPEDYADVPTADLLELAKLRLAHVRRNLPCETRGQALSILLGIRPAPPRTAKLAIKPVYERCGICWKPLIAGSHAIRLVDTTSLAQSHAMAVRTVTTISCGRLGRRTVYAWQIAPHNRVSENNP